jgi:MFS family permease
VSYPPSPPNRVGTFSPLRHRGFTLLFSGQLASALGDQAFALALPWTVLAVTGDVAQVALVLAAEAIPRVLLLPLGGALADRINPRLVMLLSDIGRAGVVGALGLTLLLGLPPLWVVALLAALQGAGSGLFLPGSQAILPWTVRNTEIPAANGLMQTILWLTMVVGPVLGGVAVAAQAAIAFLVDAVSFIISAITLAGIRLLPPDTPGAKASATDDEVTLHEDSDTSIPLVPTGVASTAEEATMELTVATRSATDQTVTDVDTTGGSSAQAEVAAIDKPAVEDRVAAGDLVDVATEIEVIEIEVIEIEVIEIEVIEIEVIEVEMTEVVRAAAATALVMPVSTQLSQERSGASETSQDRAAVEPWPVAGTVRQTSDEQILSRSPAGAKAEGQTNQAARSSVWGEMSAGMAYALGQPLMRTAIAASILGNLAYTGTFGVALILLSRNLDPSPVALGLLLGACGIGGVLGGLVAGPLGRLRRRSTLALLLWALMPVALVLVPVYAGAAAQLPFHIDLSAVNFGDVAIGDRQLGPLNFGDQIASLTDHQRLLAVAVLLGLTSCIIALGETVFITIMQQRIPSHLMARVFSVQLMAAGVAQPLSLIAAGFLSAMFGAGFAFLAAAVLFFIAAIIGLFSPALRRA